jgi:uncharacterized protein
MAHRLLGALAGGAARRPRLVVGIALALALAGAGLALGLSPSAATDTFVGRSSADYKATQSFYRHFGEEPIEVLVQENLERLLLGADVERLLGLEGCLSGRLPAKALAHEGGAEGPCGQLERLDAVKVVVGPGTFINEAAREIDSQLSSQQQQARAQASKARHAVEAHALASGRGSAEAHALGQEASKAVLAGYVKELATLAAQYGLLSPPALNNPEFVDALVFQRSAPAGTPKRRFAYLFPSTSAALISVRLKPGLGEARRARAIALIRRAVAMPQWRLEGHGRYLVTGEPVIVDDLTGTLARSLEILLVAVLLVMACVLGLVFTARPRLLPLAIALLACALTFGGLALAGGSLTVGSLAVLPALVGLAVDYAVQLQSRSHEALELGSDPALAVRSAAVLGAPTIAGAALGSAAAMLALLLSPVPLVESFGALLIAGIAIAFVCALTVGSAAIVLARRPRVPRTSHARARLLRARPLSGLRVPLRAAGGRGLSRLAPPLRRSWSGLAAAWRDAGELLRESPLPHGLVRASIGWALRAPRAVLGAGLALALLGWALSATTPVQTDITKLVPTSLPSLRSLGTLERETGVGGQIDLLVSGRDLTQPAVVEWMSSYESAVLRRYGGGAAAEARPTSAPPSGPACARAQLCPAFSLPDLFSEARAPEAAAARHGGSGHAGAGNGHAGTGSGHASAGSGGGGHAGGGSRRGAAGSPGQPRLTRAQVDGLLEVIPPYFSQNVISADRRYATLAFGIRLMPLDRQQHVIEGMRAMLHPPVGVHARLAGLAVLAAQADAQVASPWRRTLTLLLSLAIVTAILFALFRADLRRTLAVVAPVALASGWSGLLLYATQVPLNPMSVTLSILVVAVATEFSMLLAERYREERLAGRDPVEALRLTYRRTGAAVAASGVTAVAGFAVLALSQIRMLQDFGLVTLIDLGISLVGVLLVLPSVLLALGVPRGARESFVRSGDAERPRDELPLVAATGASRE